MGSVDLLTSRSGSARLVSRRHRGLKFSSPRRHSPNSLPKAPRDGETVCLNEHGVGQFNWLLGRKVEPVCHAFALPRLNGTCLQQSPLIERKNRLAELVHSTGCNQLLYALHPEEYGRHLFRKISALSQWLCLLFQIK